MKKLLLLIIVLILMGIFYYFKDSYSENRLKTCIDKLVSHQHLSQLEIMTKDRGLKPIIKGQLTQKEKDHLFDSINQQCNVLEIQDFINIYTPEDKIDADLSFQMDYVNHIVNISGTVNEQQQVDEILQSLKTAIQTQLTKQQSQWLIKPNFSIDKRAKFEEFSTVITLLFSAISPIRFTDISIAKGQIVLKGLVRDNLVEQQILHRVKQLLADQYSINNQLELVVNHQIKIPAFQLKKLTLPELEKPTN